MRASGKSDILLKEPTRRGYYFRGWYDKEGNQIKVIPKGNEKNITVYARWDKITSAK